MYLEFCFSFAQRGKEEKNRQTRSYAHHLDHSSLFNFAIQLFDQEIYSVFSVFKVSMSANISTDSDVFYVEQTSNDRSPPRPNTPIVLNSTEMSGNDTREMPSISSITSPEPQIVMIDSDSNDPTLPYGFGRQFPIVPPSLSDLYLPPNPFNILATMAVVNQTENAHDETYCPQSPEPSELSSISTPPMNVSTVNSWETSFTTTDDNTFYTSDEPRRVYWAISSDDHFGSNDQRNLSVASSGCGTPPPPRAQKRNLSIGMSFPKKGGVSQHTCEACGQPLPVKRTPWCSGKTQNTVYVKLDFECNYIMYFKLCAYIWIRIWYVSPPMHVNIWLVYVGDM